MRKLLRNYCRMAKGRAVTYVVPGHPLVAERTVQLLIEKEREGIVQLEIAGGNSFLGSDLCSAPN